MNSEVYFGIQKKLFGNIYFTKLWEPFEFLEHFDNPEHPLFTEDIQIFRREKNKTINLTPVFQRVQKRWRYQNLLKKKYMPLLRLREINGKF